MQDAFIVKGGKKLKGTVKLSGAKNVALKVLIASLLFDRDVEIANVPHILDIKELIHLINKLGASASFVGPHTVLINGKGIREHKVDLLHASKIRTSFMLFAPLLYKFGRAVIPNPGGCRLGARPIDRHIDMMKAFGVSVVYDSSTGYYNANLKNKEILPAKYRFNKPSHTGTELAILFGILADGKSVIENAAFEPEIDDYISFLNTYGAKIKRNKSSIVVNGGIQSVSKRKPYTIMCDRNEAVTYASFALATKGDVVIEGLDANNISYFIKAVGQIGGGVEEKNNSIRFFHVKSLKSLNITTRVHPGFMTDWQGPWAVLMTQARGTSTLHETVFEYRFSYVSELQKLGANIEFYQPRVDSPHKVYQFNISKREELDELRQAIKITGKTKLHNGILKATDIRAGAALLIAASIASGESYIEGASIIERGYEDIDKKLRNIGVDIKKV